MESSPLRPSRSRVTTTTYRHLTQAAISRSLLWEEERLVHLEPLHSEDPCPLQRRQLCDRLHRQHLHSRRDPSTPTSGSHLVARQRQRAQQGVSRREGKQRHSQHNRYSQHSQQTTCLDPRDSGDIGCHLLRRLHPFRATEMHCLNYSLRRCGHYERGSRSSTGTATVL